MKRLVEQENAGIEAKHPSAGEGKLRDIGGSQSDDFNNIIANQAVNALWTKHSDKEG